MQEEYLQYVVCLSIATLAATMFINRSEVKVLWASYYRLIYTSKLHLHEKGQASLFIQVAAR